MNPTTEQKYINKICELEKRIEKLENLQYNREQAETKAYFDGQNYADDYMKAVRKDCGLYE